MRFGAQIFERYETPEQWLAIVKRKGLRAVYNPVLHPEDEGEIQAYVELCRENDLKIAEVGAWGYSFVSRSAAVREQAFDHAAAQLRLADKLGAATCVNVSGNRGTRWDGTDPENFSDETYRMIVLTMQRLLDTVQPQHTTFSLEPMPWMVPDSLECYQKLLTDIDRDQFAVHYDPCNIIASHRDYANNGVCMKQFLRALGPRICSVHMKDVLMETTFNTVILEKKPGQGELDYHTLLTELNHLHPDLPVMTEHMELESDSLRAEAYIRMRAEEAGVSL